MIKELLIKIKLRLLGLKYIDVSDRALYEYKNFVRDNNTEDDFTLKLKLNRNYACSKTEIDFEDTIVKKYGNLNIVYSKSENKIITVNNNKGRQRKFYIDKAIKDKYDAVLNKDKVGVVVYE